MAGLERGHDNRYLNRGIMNGSFKEAFNAVVTESGGTVTLTLTEVGGGFLTLSFSDGLTTFTGTNTIDLTTGSDTNPTANYIYILKSDKILTKSTSGWPSTEHNKISYLLCQSAASVQAESGCYVNQNWNDFITNSNNDEGHILHIAEALRRRSARWFSGVAGNGTEGYLTPTAGNTELKSTSGIVYQLHKHTFPAVDTSTGTEVLVVNWNGDAFHNVSNLYDITADSTGTTIGNNKFFNLVIWGVANKTGEYQPMMINLPSGFYNTQTAAEEDVSGHDNFSMSREFNLESSTGFLVARITIQMKTGGGTWTVSSTVDLRGQSPQTASGGIGSIKDEFADNTFRIFDEVDNTKEVAFDVGTTVSTGNTRTMTVPDADGTLFLEENSIDKISDVVVSGTPADNELLAFDTGTGKWINQTSAEAGLGGGGGASELSDLSDVNTSTPTSGNVLRADGVDWESAELQVNDVGQIDVGASSGDASLNDVMKWNGSNWVPGTAGDTSEFSFSIDSFSDGISDTSQLIGGGANNPWKAIGAVSFTATYSNAPGGMTAEVALTGSATAWAGNLSMTPVTGAETNTEEVEYPSGATGAIVFTLTQSADGTDDTETINFANTMRFGTNSNGIGAQIDGNVENLSEVGGPNESRSQTINNISTGTVGHFLTFSHANRLSSVAQVQMNSGFGFATASFNSTATTLAPTVQTSGLTAIDNSVTFNEAFKAITSRLADLPNNTNDFKLLTSSSAQNYIYWGELNVDATADAGNVYTQSNVKDNVATQPGQVSSNSMSSRSMTVNATGSEFTYIAFPSRLGALSSIVIGGFESITDFWIDAGSGTELAITNDGGYTENYFVYVSKNPGFSDPTTMVVTI